MSKMSMNFEDPSGSYTGTTKGYLDLTAISRGDSSTPGAVKLDNSISIVTNMFGENTNISLNFKVIGDTIYYQIPNTTLIDQFVPWMTPYKAQWYSFNQQDVMALEKDNPGLELKSTYDEILNGLNRQTTELKKLEDLIKKYDKAISLRKYGSRTVKGVVQDRYIVTINKKVLENILISELPKTTDSWSSDYRKYEIQSIKDSLAKINFKSELIYIGRYDAMPYEIASINQLMENKKVQSTVKFNLSFSDFGSRFDDIVPPAQYKTTTELYNTVVKPMLKEAQGKGEQAALKSVMASFRAQAELVYEEVGGAYGTKSNNGSCTSPKLGSVFNPITKNTNGYDSSVSVKNMLSSMVNYSTSATCNSSTTAYALQASYKDATGSFCVDSTGQAKEVKSSLSGTMCGAY